VEFYFILFLKFFDKMEDLGGFFFFFFFSCFFKLKWLHLMSIKCFFFSFFSSLKLMWLFKMPIFIFFIILSTTSLTSVSPHNIPSMR
jgi:hypothetical protein